MNLKSFLLEGGNALRTTKSISQKNVQSTVKSFYDQILVQLNITENDFIITGSASKRHPEEYSGDIDLAVLSDAIGTSDINDIKNKILELNKTDDLEIRDMGGINVLSISWPIKNQIPDRVQIDIMPSESLDWSEWSYFSPNYKDSQFRGLFRNELLFALVKYTNMQIIEEDNGIPIEWSRLFLDLNKGLMTGIQSRKGKTGILKNPFTKNKTLITNNPDEVVNLIFGNMYDKDDIRTFENTLEIVTSNEWDPIRLDGKLLQVLQMTRSGIMNKKQEVPEILDYKIEQIIDN